MPDRRLTKKPHILLSPGAASIFRNAVYILGGQGVQFSVRFLYAIILARVLGPHDYGLIGYGTSLYIALVPLTKFGIEHVVIRAIGSDKSRGRELLRSSLPLRKLTAYVTTLAFAVAVLTWESDPQAKVILAFFSLAMLGRSFAQWNLAMFTAFEANRFSFRLQAIFRPLEVALGLVALAIWRNPLAIVLVHAGVWWMEVVFGTRLLRKEFSIPAGEWNFSDLKTILAESIPMCILVTLTSVMCQGPLLIFKNLNATGIAAGNLALAMQVFSILSQVSIALSSASYPALSRTIARGDGKEVFYVETIMRFILLFGALLAFLGTAMGPDMVPIVFGQQYAEAGTLIGTTLWMMIPWTTLNTLMRVQTARRNILSTLLMVVIGVLLFVLTSIPATEIYGSQGTVLAALAGMAFISTAFFIAVARQGNIDVKLVIVRPLCALGFAGYAFHLLSPVGPWLSLAGSWTILFIAWIALGCITREELTTVLNICRRRSSP